MKHYTQFLLATRIHRGGVDRVLNEMFQRSVSAASFTDMQYSDYYGQIQKVFIGCIEKYSRSILQIFDFESVLEFIKNINNIAKEKGTQVVEQFIH